ncbi:Fe3+-hydroxamate ABC transporter substrate-binding protein [Halogeometricum pallidum JCM 14848]|uniref:Fe3+-hydroxamate ABC transporter substrate-binding protein n=1 Tax=Halogeometricum pallidum JCM 14848 TaxID=1227487 RepID=M0CVM5_HALPD|nr:PGF-CTERM-anchored ABC transporter substrate-binding protein [Halogeometricum pallidum]ELZ26683.1 Fe3+-hydroxamate ABC transporter substrate-binding protein [Halogeometricum pallidum JCM 14848]
MRLRTLSLVTLLLVAAAAPISGAAAAGASAVEQQSTTTQAEACSFPYSATDATGTEVTLESDPERVVTLNPSAAQTMWEIGARDEVVGVSQYAAYLDGASEKANVSGANGANVEKVLAANPDLVLVPSSSYGASKERVDQLRAQGVPVFVFGEGTSLAYVANKTEQIGRLTGNCEAGRATADDIRESVSQMREVLAGAEKPVGLNYFYGYTSGSETFIGDVMTTAGLRNGAAEANITGFAQINDETVVEMNPEYVVAPEESPVPANEAWNSTTAIRENNVIRVDTNYLQQPAPRSVDAAETIMQAVHPEAYEEYRAMQAENGTATGESTTAAETTTTVVVDDTPPETGAETGTGTETDADSPGFGVLAGLVALVGAAMLAARR